MRILSIQSWVSYGYVGNAAAVFAVQRLGGEVHAVNTVTFSNHPGHGDWTGRVTPAGEIGDLVEGLARRGALARCDAVLSGYLGTAENAGATLDAVHRVRDAHHGALYCCDPVIGDGGRVYVQPAIPDALVRDLLPQADILTPNQFELEMLTGTACAGEQGLAQALGAIRRAMRPAGPRVVLLTSAVLESTPAGTIEAIAVDDYGATQLLLPLLDIPASGAGDLTAALFLFHYLHSRSARRAAEAAIASVQGVLRRTALDRSRDLRLIDAQAELRDPSERWEMQVLRNFTA